MISTSGKWKTARVFISSTFLDMHAERDYLVKVVFPALRQRLFPHRIYLDDIDLRWGVTNEQDKNGQALRICLERIDDCRPFFVCLLGERYGSVPHQYPADAVARFGWVKNYSRRSITELEILHGVLNDSSRHQRAFFYFRDPAVLKDMPPSVRDLIYLQSDPQAVQGLQELKDRIRQSGWPLNDGYHAAWDGSYFHRASETQGRLSDLSYFGLSVEADLWDALAKEYGISTVPELLRPDETFTTERDEHQRFLESQLRVFVGRDDVYDAVARYVSQPSAGPHVVVGPSGFGKTALLAQFVSRYREHHPQAIILPHFVGASSRSTRLNDLLRHACTELRALTGRPADVELPDTHGDLVSLLETLLQSASFASPVTLVIDAPERMESDDRPYDLHWLPPPGSWPPGLSVLIGTALETPNGRLVMQAVQGRPHSVSELGPLSDQEQRQILDRVPSLAAKSLDAGQQEQLLANPATANPLFLRAVLEELRGFGSFKQLNERIARFPGGKDAVRELFDQVLENLEQEYSPQTVRDVCTLLLVARRGLSERELYELLTGAAPGDTPLLASVFYRAQSEGCGDLFAVLRWLRLYLVQRRSLVAVHSRGLEEAIAQRYLSAPEARRAAHRRLADYFGAASLTGSITDEGILRYCPSFEAFHAKGAELSKLLDQRFMPDLLLYTPRKIDELPWHLLQCEDWDQLYATLADEMFFSLLHYLDAAQLQAYWHAIESHSSLRLIQAYEPIIGAPHAHADSAHRVAMLLAAYGHLPEALRLWTRLIEHWESGGAAAEALASAWAQKANLLMEQQCWEEAGAALDASQRYFEQSGAPAEHSDRADKIVQQARAVRNRGDHQLALRMLDEHERLCQHPAARTSLGHGLTLRGFILRDQGHIEQSLECFRRAEEAYRHMGHSEGVTVSLYNQAMSIKRQGDLAMADSILLRMEQASDHIGKRRADLFAARQILGQENPLSTEKQRRCNVLFELATAREKEGDFDGALKAIMEQEVILRNAGAFANLVDCLLNKTHLLAGGLAQADRAEEALNEAESLVQQHQLHDKKGLVRFKRLYVEGAKSIPPPPAAAAEAGSGGRLFSALKRLVGGLWRRR